MIHHPPRFFEKKTHKKRPEKKKKRKKHKHVSPSQHVIHHQLGRSFRTQFKLFLPVQSSGHKSIRKG